MTKFGWTVTLLILLLLGSVVAGIVFFLNRAEAPLPKQDETVLMPEPLQEIEQAPNTSATSTPDREQASSSPAQ